MQIQEDTSAICLQCNKIIFNAVPCATIEQYYANGGRKRTSYRRIHYFREWMSYIQGHRPVFFGNKTMKEIKDNLEEPTLQGLKKTLKKLKLGHYKSVSYLLSEITGEKIPEVSRNTILQAEQMFIRLDKNISYYPDIIYEIFYTMDVNHPLLKWIPKKMQN